jgi:muramoyltetrapeptide carboxypeptidase
VGLVEPSWSSGDRFDIALAAETVRAMGLVPKLGRNVGERYGYLAGRDEQRAADFNAMFADPTVRAIFAIRGGSGAARILPLLDWRTIRANPKLLIGYSDVTALHMAIAARAGTPTLHAPMLTFSSHWGKLSWNAFRALAFDGATPTYGNPPGTEDRLVQRSGRIRTFRPGKASGRLLGGNLTVLTSLMGTPYLPDFDGAILFLEDVDEGPYRIDRMLTQLALGGILGRVAGVVFGQCTRCTDGGSMLGGFTVSEVLDQHLTPLRIPAFEGALVGHIPDQYSFPVGIRAEIDATAGTIRILEPAVA